MQQNNKTSCNTYFFLGQLKLDYFDGTRTEALECSLHPILNVRFTKKPIWTNFAIQQLTFPRTMTSEHDKNDQLSDLFGNGSNSNIPVFLLSLDRNMHCCHVGYKVSVEATVNIIFCITVFYKNPIGQSIVSRSPSVFV